MTEPTPLTTVYDWNKQQLFLFRIVFILMLLLTVPLHWEYYDKLFSLNIFNLHFQDLFQITNDVPRLINIAYWGIAAYAGWGLALVIAIIGALIWTNLDRHKPQQYEQLYYWLRVIVRYRLALGLIGYGVIKLFPVQVPDATLSDLHTAYGDFLPWKIYYLSTGVARAYYEQTLGGIEIIAGLLLLCRRTAVIGAGIAFAFLINIVLVNFAYQLGEHVYSLYLLLAASFILAYDAPRLYELLVKEKVALADHFRPELHFKHAKKIRYTLKALFGLFVISFSLLTFSSFKKSNWPYPDTPGLSKAYGVYNVKTFKINGTVLPYSLTDTSRWQDVVFEKWNVLSVKTNNPAPIDLSSPDLTYQEDKQRSYESKGNGGRSFYSYILIDSTITLSNKNAALDVQRFKISRPDPATVILNGSNAQGDSLYIELDKLDKTYLLHKGRRKPVQIY